YAQNQWHYLPNNGFHKGYSFNDSAYRIEDVYFTSRNTGFAVTTTNRLLKTTDGGDNWAIKNDTLDFAGFRSIEFLDDAVTGIAGSLNSTGKVFRTTDRGETWLNISASITDTTTTSSKRICGLAHYGNNFYGVGWWGSDVAKFYKSTDKGVTWQTKYMDTNLATGLVEAWFVSADTGFVAGTRDNAVMPPASVILKTTDGGSTWTEVFSDTVLAGYVWKLQFVNKDVAVGAVQNLFFRDSVNMVYSKDGGNSWQVLAVGKRQPTINFGGGTQACGFATPAKGWVGGYYDGIFETADSGKTWTHLQFGYDFNRIFVIDSTLVYAGGHMPYRYGSKPTNIRQEPMGSRAPHLLYPVSPNPGKGLIRIEFELYAETNVVIKVVNIDSRKVYHVANTHLDKGKYEYRWDGSSAPAGNYFVWLGNDAIPLTQKFVLLK
ncbi:MAG TPA: YCF48-related protein, partial [Flavipsychrobacter sp.]